MPGGYDIHPDWAGSGTFTYQQNDANTTSDAFQAVGDRVTEFHDFNSGDVSNTSGNTYRVHGRGHTTFNSATGALPHDWTVTYDFSSLSSEYLPAGTMIGLTDVDGSAVGGEEVTMTASLAGGGSIQWLAVLDQTVSSPLHGTGAYEAAGQPSNGYYWDEPSVGNAAAAMITTENIVSLSVHANQGTGGGSYGIKLGGPIILSPDAGYTYTALVLTGTQGSSTFPSGTFTGGYYQNMPVGSEDFDFSFDNGFIPSGYIVDPNWAGDGTFSYQQNDANTTSNVFVSAGDRTTEFHDFNPGDLLNTSCDVYHVYGRGQTSFNSATGALPHDWNVTYNFSTLSNGYLPSGTLLGLTDIDGLVAAGESLTLTATLSGGGSAQWLVVQDQTVATPLHGTSIYEASGQPANSYYWDGPSVGNAAATMLTSEDIVSITLHATQGTGGS